MEQKEQVLRLRHSKVLVVFTLSNECYRPRSPMERLADAADDFVKIKTAYIAGDISKEQYVREEQKYFSLAGMYKNWGCG